MIIIRQTDTSKQKKVTWVSLDKSITQTKKKTGEASKYVNKKTKQKRKEWPRPANIG
jgi:hypothetical protein